MEEACVNTTFTDKSNLEEDEEKKNKDANEEEHVTGRKKRRERKLKAQPKNVTGRDSPDTGAPRGICISDFVQARATELHNMTAAISQQGGARRTFQTLPRHMRRRSMSHNIKRLPHRLREQAKNEVNTCGTKYTLIYDIKCCNYLFFYNANFLTPASPRASSTNCM